jgi:hypothetical protein
LKKDRTGLLLNPVILSRRPDRRHEEIAPVKIADLGHFGNKIVDPLDRLC